jgi:hypothetical protein
MRQLSDASSTETQQKVLGLVRGAEFLHQGAISVPARTSRSFKEASAIRGVVIVLP